MKEKKAKLSLLVDLYITFFKLGCFSFGGGYAMIPLIEREVVEEKKWVEREKIVDIFAISQSIPGAIALNSAGFVGYYIAGITGAIVALLGNLTPPLLIVLTLSVLFEKFSSSSLVQAVFKGIRPAIIGLIAYAGYKIGRTSIKDTFCFVIALGAFVAVLFMDVHPVVTILCGAVVGIAIKYLRPTKGEKEERM